MLREVVSHEVEQRHDDGCKLSAQDEINLHVMRMARDGLLLRSWLQKGQKPVCDSGQSGKCWLHWPYDELRHASSKTLFCPT